MKEGTIYSPVYGDYVQIFYYKTVCRLEKLKSIVLPRNRQIVAQTVVLPVMNEIFAVILHMSSIYLEGYP